MLNLGSLEYQEGNVNEARQWLEKAIATSDPDAASYAMFSLGVIAADQGDLENARRCWERTIGMGFPPAVACAEETLRELDRSEHELRRAGHFAQYGWKVYADPQLMKPKGDPQETGDLEPT
jgi:tetratricopeptide (TPR) repeat protein